MKNNNTRRECHYFMLPDYEKEVSEFMDSMERMKGEQHGRKNDPAEKAEQKRTA